MKGSGFSMNELEYGNIFEKGIPNPYGEFFSGKSYIRKTEIKEDD